VKKRTVGRGNNKQVQYLARWKGYRPEYDQWLSESELGNAREMIRDFEEAEARKQLAAKAARDGRRSNRVKGA
jgi:hypothetical protein